MTAHPVPEPGRHPGPHPAGGLHGRVAVVTGAAGGIGAATARRLAAEGASVALLDIVDTAPEATSIARDTGRPALALRGDVADEAAWTAAVARCRSALGAVDVLVSNAYTVEVAPAHRTGPASWDRQLAVNLTGAFLGVRACLDDLVRHDRGSVVLVSSVHALIGLPGRAAYAASKAGLTGLARQLATEYGGTGLRVNSVLPGPVLTGAWADVPAGARAGAAGQTVLRRLGRAEEVAAAIAFLAGDDASFVTGAALVVDGGWSTVKTSA
ncbi:MAG TPA: SDR family NAD(P)-dependent oxidoreductase [Pseudonocardia sp.]|jgi:NAD(P)-dependent dehydrogenase (short-subunit alcohol dehydrogenase family)